MAQTKTEKVLGLVSEAEVIEERKAVAKLLFKLNGFENNYTQAKLAELMEISLIDFHTLYANLIADLWWAHEGSQD